MENVQELKNLTNVAQDVTFIKNDILPYIVRVNQVLYN
jgi:hypothetical protein